MRKEMIVLVALLAMIAGCALYGNEAQYGEGDWYFIAGSGEVAKIQQDKLALKKLEAQPVQGDRILGYEGLVANFNKYKRFNFILYGPERKGYPLEPGELKEDFLVPGIYSCVVYRNGYQVGNPWIFHVTAQTHSFHGKKYHWYVYME